MLQLLMVVMALSLSAAMALASINYLPGDRMAVREVESITREALVDLRTGWEDYRTIHGTELAVTDGLAVLTPSYVFLPPAPAAGLTWSYGGDPAVGYWFCLSGEMSEIAHTAFERNARYFSPQAYFLDDDCGSLTSGGLPTRYPAERGLTLWVVRF